MTFKLFYTDYSKDKHVRSDEAKPATFEKIIDSMNKLLHEPDNFIGIIDTNDVMLQFMVEDSGTICIDAPTQDGKGSYTKSTNLNECIEIVTAIRENIVLDEIKGLEYKSWGR